MPESERTVGKRGQRPTLGVDGEGRDVQPTAKLVVAMPEDTPITEALG